MIKRRKAVTNIPPMDAQIATGTGPWRVTRDASGRVIMIEVWTEPAAPDDWRFTAPQGYVMVRGEGRG